MMLTRLHAATALLWWSALAPHLDAQTAPPQAPPIAGFQDGFFIQTSNGDNRLLFGLVAQTDARFSIGDTLGATNTLALRKLRPTLSGRVGRYFDFKVMPDFGNGTVVGAFYEWPTFVHMLGQDYSNLSNGKHLLAATAAFKNEPFPW
jgi:hypothetical protein